MNHECNANAIDEQSNIQNYESLQKIRLGHKQRLGLLGGLMSPSYFDTPRPHLLAHRGLNQHRADIDENSLAAFDQAIAAGCTHLESDVHATKDGVAVLFHDDDLLRVAGLPQKISDLTFHELSQIRLKFGSTIPSLDSVLAAYPQLRLNLDVKSEGAIYPTAQAINSAGAHNRVLVSSFSSSRRRKTLRLLSAPVATSASMREVLLLLTSNFFFGLGAKQISKNIHALQIPVSQGPIRLATKSFIGLLRRHNLEVHFWTINNSQEAKKLIALGATGIVSDRIDLIEF